MVKSTWLGEYPVYDGELYLASISFLFVSFLAWNEARQLQLRVIDYDIPGSHLNKAISKI